MDAELPGVNVLGGALISTLGKCTAACADKRLSLEMPLSPWQSAGLSENAGAMAAYSGREDFLCLIKDRTNRQAAHVKREREREKIEKARG